MNILTQPLLGSLIATLSGIIAYFIARQKLREHEEATQEPTQNIPLWLGGILWLCAEIIVFFLPHPWNMALGISVLTLGINAWSDFKLTYLWDEITYGTLLLVGLYFTLFGEGGAALAGLVAAGSVAFLIWAIGCLSGRETGFGDVTIMGVIGLCLGPTLGICDYIFAIFACLILTFVWAWKTATPFADLKKMPIPFGPFLVFIFIILGLLYPWLGSIRTFFG